MERLGELQSKISDIRAFDAEVIALSSRGDVKDVQRTREQLKLTYSLIPRPITKLIEDFELSKNRFGISYSTVIIDKKGIVRFVHDSSSEFDYPSISKLISVLQQVR